MKGIKVIEDPIKVLRKEREKVCFKVINRGKLWYDTLTYAQLAELRHWYRAWLDVTVTMKIPEKPIWLNDKVEEEEIII